MCLSNFSSAKFLLETMEYPSTAATCLICCEPLPETKNDVDLHMSKILNGIFERLCCTLRVKFPRELRKWDFLTEPFPFCTACRKEIVKICRFQDELEKIQKNIESISAKLKVRIIESKDDQCEPNPTRKFRKSKYEYFRNVIKQRYQVRVRLKDFKGMPPHSVSPNSKEVDSDIYKNEEELIILQTDGEERKNSVHPVNMLVGRSGGSSEASVSKVSSSKETYVELEPPPEALHSAFYDEGLSDLVDCEYEEDVQLIMGDTQRVSQFMYENTTTPAEIIPATMLQPVARLPYQSYVDSIPRKRRFPADDRKPKGRKHVVLIDKTQNKYSYSGITFRKTGEYLQCSACVSSVKFRPDNDHFVNIRNHINNVHLGADKKSRPVVTLQFDSM